MDAHTSFKTDHANRYLGTLCKHFGNKVPVHLSKNKGRIEFPFGQCELVADEASLELKASSKNHDDLDKIIEVITSHLDRFAFRENPKIEWKTEV